MAGTKRKRGITMSEYTILKQRHQQEVNDFPFIFAFSNQQFEEGMAKYGLTPKDTDKIYKFGSTGGFYLRTDAPRLKEMFDRHEKEKQEAISADTKGNGYIYQMFLYELANHEYGYTGDVGDTQDALGLTVEEVAKSKPLSYGLYKAIKEIRRQESKK